MLIRTNALLGVLVLSLSLTQLASPAVAATVDGEESYDLLFRNGTLDEIEPNETLTYEREVTSTLKPEAEARDSGRIFLMLDEDAPMAQIEFRQGQKYRRVGKFPASVGNPMIMYFYETIVRDMAEVAGGSPFYIRNRVKDALTQPSEMETGQAIHDGRTVETTTINLYPFAEDPNKDRMRGFGDLVLSVTMSEEIPGWYLSLIAEARPEGAEAPVYRSIMVFDGVEAAQ